MYPNTSIRRKEIRNVLVKFFINSYSALFPLKYQDKLAEYLAIYPQ